MIRFRSFTKYLVVYYFLHLLTVHGLAADVIFCYEADGAIHAETFEDAEQCLVTNSALSAEWFEYGDASNPHCESCTDIPMVFSSDADATALSSFTTQFFYFPISIQNILYDCDQEYRRLFRQYNAHQGNEHSSIIDGLQSIVLLI